MHQRTLAAASTCTGVGLHSGVGVTLTLRPASENAGIVFKRLDVADSRPIPARWDRVVDTRLCTTLGNEDGLSVATVEHLMAALAGCGVDNAIVELDGPEVPIMDGSAQPFVALIDEAGLVEQAAPLRIIRLRKPVVVEDGARVAALIPGEGFSLSFEIAFDSRSVARQAITVGLVNGTFKRELARARTFGFLDDVEALRAMGLARGGSLENAVVISGDRILNEDGLRFDDEFVRHKALDAVGDLYLAGARIVGRFQGICSGHEMNNRLLRALFADEDAWGLVTVEADRPRPAAGSGWVTPERVAASPA